MITPATIINKTIGNNKELVYTVSISIFKTPGSTKDPLFTAVCASNPGTYEPYCVGDLVYVGFIDNEMAKPVILGKIGKDIPSSSLEKSSSFQYLNALEVTDNVKLPENTTIGDVSYTTLKGCINTVSTLSSTNKSYENLKFGISPTITSTSSGSPIGVWIDGKTIYRRLFKETLSETSTWTHTISFANLTFSDIWIDTSHTFVYGNGVTVPCGCSAGYSTIFNCYINKTTKSIVCSGGASSSYPLTTLIATIEYTQ